MASSINSVSSICSYMMFRHFGGLSSVELSQPIVATYAGFTPILPAAAAGQPLVFKDDIAHAETPSRSYPQDTGFRSTGMQFINDDTTSIFFSLDGIRDHFELKAGENILFDFIRAQGIWLRGAAGGENYRLIVW